MKNGNIKILHVINSLGAGGLENGVVNVVQSLPHPKFQSHICCLEKGGDFVTRLPEKTGLTVLNKPPGVSVRTVLHVARVLEDVKPDVVHTHNLGPLIYTALACVLDRKRPILHGEHGFPHGLITPRAIRQRRWFYHACVKVHTVSKGLRELLMRHGLPGDKIEVVLNGVDTERHSVVPAAIARERIQLPPNGPVLGIVGRFDPLKCHLPLIEAFETLILIFPTAQLLVVGEGGLARDRVVERARQSPVAGRIHLVGFQKDPQMYYQAMDLLVVPSLFEGLSNVVLEAMSCGVPVLAHQACGNAEMITNGYDGLIANLEKTEALAANIEAALSDPARLASLGHAARQKVLADFSISKMIENYSRLYCQIAASR